MLINAFKDHISSLDRQLKGKQTTSELLLTNFQHRSYSNIVAISNHEVAEKIDTPKEEYCKRSSINHINLNNDNESAKLRALRAKNVLTCQGALRAYLSTSQRALRAYMLTCLACLCAHVPCVLTGSRANVSCVPTCLACLRAHVPCVLTCQRASFDVTIFSFAAIVAEVAQTVDKI